MGRLLAKGIFFAVSLAALLLGSEALVTSFTPWRRYEDPRARILWDGAFDGTRIVLLGGSEFASPYVDSLSEALWVRIERHTGRRVFPGALNGARSPDIVAGAVHVSREWPEGTTAFISLAPTRFLESRAEERATGNFAEIYFRRYGIDATNGGVLRRFQGQIYARLLRPFFAARTRSALASLVDQPRRPGWMRYRVWYQEAQIARGRFEFFERHLVIGARPRRFQWVDQIKQQLEAAHMRPVFVLTPLNESLIRSFARLYPPDELLRDIRGTVATVKAHLEESRATVVDLTDGEPAECFFDMVHVNTCGDDLMAIKLAEWLNEHPDD
jgi:hypothetical protein